MRRSRLWVLLLTLMAVSVAQANGDKAHDRARRLREAGVIVPVEPLVTEAKQRLHGRLLEIDFGEDDKGNYVYEIELIDDKGTVREFYYDARTGKFMRESIHTGHEQWRD